MSSLRLFRYSGSKLRYINEITCLIDNKHKYEQYVESCLGSGAMFLNVDDRFDKYVINDLDSNVIECFKSVKLCTYEDFANATRFVETTFGSIANSKKSYYCFRDWFNSSKLTSNDDDKGFYIMMLYSSCINSLARWGPNGFNTSYGNRLYLPSKQVFIAAKHKLSKTDMHNTTFQKVMEDCEQFDDKTLLFHDPPYIKRPTSYATISSDVYENMLTWLSSSKLHWIYTDTENGQLQKFKRIILRENIVQTNPGKIVTNKKHSEIAITNIHLKNVRSQIGLSAIFNLRQT